MAEYIERKTLIAWLENMHGTKNIINAIQNKKRFPSADVVEVKYGEWLPGHYEGGIFDGLNFDKCSECQYERLIDDVKFKTHFKYCPNCGAKMKGGV